MGSFEKKHTDLNTDSRDLKERKKKGKKRKMKPFIGENRECVKNTKKKKGMKNVAYRGSVKVSG